MTFVPVKKANNQKRLLVRVEPDLYDRVVEAAQKSGISRNEFLKQALQFALRNFRVKSQLSEAKNFGPDSES